MTHTIRTSLAVALACALLAAGFAASAGAIVPPRNCGNVKVGSRTFNIKADQLRCTSAKKYGVAYVRSHKAPRYYRCKHGASGSALYAQCVATRYNPDRTLYIIRR